MATLPTPGAGDDTWGAELNNYLSVAHEADGTLKAGGTKLDVSTATTKGDIFAATAAATVTRRAVGSNGAALVANSANSDGLAYEFNPQWFPLYKSGFYYFCNSPGNSSTSGALGNNTVRATPFVVSRSVSITRLGAEFTVAGEANSILRLGIFNDDATGLPGTVALDAGSISTGSGNAGTVATGGTPGVYEITVSATLPPGMYWAAGVVQGASTTQPTVRTIGASSLVFPIPQATIPGVGGSNTAFQMTGVSGALTTWSGSTGAGTAARLVFKVA